MTKIIEEDLFELYKRFQFNLNQLLNVRDHIQLLSNIEARALVIKRFYLNLKKLKN